MRTACVAWMYDVHAGCGCRCVLDDSSSCDDARELFCDSFVLPCILGAVCSAASFSRAMTGGCGAVFELLTQEKVGVYCLVGDCVFHGIGMITITTAIVRSTLIFDKTIRSGIRVWRF